MPSCYSYSSPPTEAIRSRSQRWAWTAYPHLSFSPLDHRNHNLWLNSLISCYNDWLPPQPMKCWGWPMKDGTLHNKFCCELGKASAPMTTQQEECALSRPSRLVDGAARFWAWWWRFIDYLIFYFSLWFYMIIDGYLFLSDVSWCIAGCTFPNSHVILELGDLTSILISHNNIELLTRRGILWLNRGMKCHLLHRRSIAFLKTYFLGEMESMHFKSAS